MEELFFGIDLGGTKIEGVVLNEQGAVLSRQRLPTEKEKGYDHIIGQIKKVLSLTAAEASAEPRRLGIGTPGAIDPPTGLMKNSNTTILNGRPFEQDLQAALGIPIRMANDANCFAIAETLLGAAKPYTQQDHLVFGVIMGTGVGGGIVINGKVWDGRQGIGGEWGHSYLDASGGSCYCGQVGCVERLIAGPALERYYQSISGQQRKLAEIIADYQQGKAGRHELATVERLLHFFGRGMANIINILDPTVIVLGGGLSKIDFLYTEGIKRVEQYVFNPRLATPIIPPQLGDSAGVFGAALL
jgi:predicted NBD/HSP70 family sugar kinase